MGGAGNSPARTQGLLRLHPPHASQQLLSSQPWGACKHTNTTQRGVSATPMQLVQRAATGCGPGHDRQLITAVVRGPLPLLQARPPL